MTIKKFSSDKANMRKQDCYKISLITKEIQNFWELQGMSKTGIVAE
tara:strand:+ start:433 stop:570 length:138 start_codon:yes stop_codon:yes gene_type:complete